VASCEAFGLKVGQSTPRNFSARVRELVDGHPTLFVVVDAMLLAHAMLLEQLAKLQKHRRDGSAGQSKDAQSSYEPLAALRPDLFHRLIRPHQVAAPC
jgi:hypothetical protein